MQLNVNRNLYAVFYKKREKYRSKIDNVCLSFYQTNLQLSPQSRYMFDKEILINRCTKIYSPRSKGPVENCTENCNRFAQRTIFIKSLFIVGEMIVNSQQRRRRLSQKSLTFFSKGHLFLIFVVLQIKIIHIYLISMSHTIDRVFYNPVENSSHRHLSDPSEISTL